MDDKRIIVFCRKYDYETNAKQVLDYALETGSMLHIYDLDSIDAIILEAKERKLDNVVFIREQGNGIEYNLDLAYRLRFERGIDIREN
jgi:hypothetical protein